MGIVISEVSFKGAVPPLGQICDKITEITTQNLVVLDKDEDDYFAFFARIAFECAPETDLELIAYHRGAVRRRMGELSNDLEDDPGFCSMMQNMVQGANEPAGAQLVYLQAYLGQELTLMNVALLALEALGGTPKIAFTDEQRALYERPITAGDIAERELKMK